MRTLIIAMIAVGLCGCTTIKRELVSPDGTKSTYTVSSFLNKKTIEGFTLKDAGDALYVSLSGYSSEQDAALNVVLAALEAYLKTKAP